MELMEFLYRVMEELGIQVYQLFSKEQWFLTLQLEITIHQKWNVQPETLMETGSENFQQ